jgi:hypothetical protein
LTGKARQCPKGGELHVEHSQGSIKVKTGQALVAGPDEWVRYSAPTSEGADYIAVCLPAFSPATVNRNQET